MGVALQSHQEVQRHSNIRSRNHSSTRSVVMMLLQNHLRRPKKIIGRQQHNAWLHAKEHKARISLAPRAFAGFASSTVMFNSSNLQECLHYLWVYIWHLLHVGVFYMAIVLLPNYQAQSRNTLV